VTQPNQTFQKHETVRWSIPNYWDAIALVLVIGVLISLGWGAKKMAAPFEIGDMLSISLDPVNLPYYGLRSVLRMLVGMICSLAFTFTVGTWAAKSRRAERIIIPAIDILQSVPVLSFLSLTIWGFIALFPGSLLGPECAAIFAIFTSQAWNIALSFYQSIRAVPEHWREAVDVFKLSAWQRFWRLEVPFAMPGLIWNCMVSMSASWFFVVASEALSLSNQTIRLPGIGSYIKLAVDQRDIASICYAILAMLVIILLYDQLLFRPLNAWLVRFRASATTEEAEHESWLITLFQRTHVLRQLGPAISRLWERFVNMPMPRLRSPKLIVTKPRQKLVLIKALWVICLTLIVVSCLWLITVFLLQDVTLSDWWQVIYLGAITALRVMVLTALTALIWVPIGVWIGLSPKVATIAQPIIQFLAAFPANLFFPIVVLIIVKYHLNVEIWTSPLMILGTQWYILFNVIVGTLTLPTEMQRLAKAFKVKGLLWWKRVIFPGIFPYVITGAVTAAGGAWNASIIAEVAQWGAIKLQATGLGAYITHHYDTTGDYSKVALGTIAMCILVLVINRTIWQPLYDLAEQRFRIN
jgi:NitT/TauT family transport system permease protein